jgi:hypothetical protein
MLAHCITLLAVAVAAEAAQSIGAYGVAPPAGHAAKAALNQVEPLNR